MLATAPPDGAKCAAGARRAHHLVENVDPTGGTHRTTTTGEETTSETQPNKGENKQPRPTGYTPCVRRSTGGHMCCTYIEDGSRDVPRWCGRAVHAPPLAAAAASGRPCRHARAGASPPSASTVRMGGERGAPPCSKTDPPAARAGAPATSGVPSRLPWRLRLTVTPARVRRGGTGARPIVRRGGRRGDGRRSGAAAPRVIMSAVSFLDVGILT